MITNSLWAYWLILYDSAYIERAFELSAQKAHCKFLHFLIRWILRILKSSVSFGKMFQTCLYNIKFFSYITFDFRENAENRQNHVFVVIVMGSNQFSNRKMFMAWICRISIFNYKNVSITQNQVAMRIQGQRIIWGCPTATVFILFFRERYSRKKT